MTQRGKIGTSAQYERFGPPNLRPEGLTACERKAARGFWEYRRKIEEDPAFAAKVSLKRQLASASSTLTPHAKKMKKSITLARFSWDQPKEES